MIKKCANAAAMALDCTVSLKFGLSDFADMVRVEPLEKSISEYLSDFGHKVGDVSPATGSSDMGNVSYRCPAIQPLLSITDDNLALHTTAFRDATLKPQAHESIACGAASMTALALKILNDADYRSNVHHSWETSLKKKENI